MSDDSSSEAEGVYSERLATVERTIAWERHGAPQGASVHPDGCMDLIWIDDVLLVAGPDTRSQQSSSRGDRDIVGLRFGPGVGPDVLGVPAQELRDQRVPLDALWSSASVRTMTDRVAESDDRAVALETIAHERLEEHGPPDPFASAVVRSLQAGMPVSHIASATSFSERQLHRRCLAAFGYGAKTLGRVLRFQRALGLLDDEPLGTVAALAGYADQAHLAREVKTMTGSTPSRLTL